MRSVGLTNPHRMTLLVLRDANQPVKQIQVSKPLVMAVPLIALLSISGLIVSLQLQHNQTTRTLEELLQSQSLKFEAVVTDKNEAIQKLQNEVISLSSQSKEMMERMERVAELEAELQKFIDKYGGQGELGKLSALTIEADDSFGLGGEFIAVYDNEIEQLAQETRDNYLEMSAMLDEMEKNVPITLRKAKQTQYSISGTPSEWPTLSKRLTSNFGYRTDPFKGSAAFHAGIDIAGKVGDPVYAAGAGKVINTDRDGSHGKYIVIEHPGGLQTWYLHLSSIDVSTGDTVTKGESIGKLGNTGRSTGPHLHFEIVKQGKQINPLPYLEQ
ncbi:murein DD-endopeptidase MepM/ murein hydrolase activator NlpD [Fontibacillus solani]|uniref:Murein DD-endopeptidase MepM/ murein hydrolase activator NlpD n=1 Tax=Fontibacillus solani TaxID=1572857 RepID=A0A7W3SSN7_9BACL|nr:M23 family metallopeptidase [Fontibacillus solani]MBA9085447.1 murein DD-endopeptidase MepM/ murein hydrolase activator NlpD [Fontibacillus solani]